MQVYHYQVSARDTGGIIECFIADVCCGGLNDRSTHQVVALYPGVKQAPIKDEFHAHQLVNATTHGSNDPDNAKFLASLGLCWHPPLVAPGALYRLISEASVGQAAADISDSKSTQQVSAGLHLPPRAPRSPTSISPRPPRLMFLAPPPACGPITPALTLSAIRPQPLSL